MYYFQKYKKQKKTMKNLELHLDNKTNKNKLKHNNYIGSIPSFKGTAQTIFPEKNSIASGSLYLISSFTISIRNLGF